MEKMRRQIVAAIVCAALVSGCVYSPMFGFPVQEGDVDAGRQAFIDHRCQQCHSVAGVRLPPLAGAEPPILELGGETTFATNYAQLMTSVINPNHHISERYREQMGLNLIPLLESPMPTPQIDNMSVRQLIDLVAFLDSRFVLIEGYDSE